MCYEELHGMATDTGADRKKPSGLRSEPLFQDLIAELERQHNTGLFVHPKLDKLQSLAVDYFVQSEMDAGQARNGTSVDATDKVGAPGDQTKMMVFTNFRASVDEIVELLNTHQPLIRATRFIGQGSDKHGRKGIAQKDQLEVECRVLIDPCVDKSTGYQVVKNFKDGVYNVLVATSIGEEGLDIGEVDMIICYDAQKTPIRMVRQFSVSMALTLSSL
jgi:ATP-dependent DNA helicase MPH1